MQCSSWSVCFTKPPKPSQPKRTMTTAALACLLACLLPTLKPTFPPAALASFAPLPAR